MNILCAPLVNNSITANEINIVLLNNYLINNKKY